MKLVFYSPQFLPSKGGLQNVVHYWAQALTDKGHEVIVICTTPAEDYPRQAYPVYRNAGFSETVRLMRQSDLVIMFNVSLKAIPQWLISKRPLVISHHSAYRYEHLPATWQQRLKRKVANRLAAGNIACSSYICRDYRCCSVVPNPYDNKIFYNRHQSRKPGSVLFVGRLVTDKGVDLLIEAMHGIIDSGFPDATLTIAGDGPEGNKLKKLAQKYSLDDRIVFTGSLSSSDIALLMNRHEVLAVPSRLEPFGLVVLEGLACGCKLVVSRTGGLSEAAGRFAEFCELSVASLQAALESSLQEKRTPEDRALEAHLAKFSLQGSGGQLETSLKSLL